MVTYKTDEVFGISRGLPLNYVSRDGVDESFIDNLTRDRHIVIHGSSKQGKTNLRKQCLQEDDYITVTCSNRWSLRDLHTSILKAVGYTITEQNSKTHSGHKTLTASITIAGTGIAVAGDSTDSENSTRRPLELDPGDVNDVILALDTVDFSRYIVLEDFHYLSTETQRDFSVALKAFHENSDVCFIIVGVWLDQNRLTLHNGDLSGRVVAIDADQWTEDELREVIQEGERLLNLQFQSSFVDEIVNECQGSVSIVQEACSRACREADVFETLPTLRTIEPGVQARDLVKSVVDDQGGRYSSFLVKFSEGFTRTDLEMYKWILYPVLMETFDTLRAGLRLPDIREALNKTHPQAPLNTGNITQALQSTANLQVAKELKPIILDYDQTSRRLSVVDRGFLIWLMHQNRDDLLESVGLPTSRHYSS